MSVIKKALLFSLITPLFILAPRMADVSSAGNCHLVTLQNGTQTCQNYNYNNYQYGNNGYFQQPLNTYKKNKKYTTPTYNNPYYYPPTYNTYPTYPYSTSYQAPGNTYYDPYNNNILSSSPSYNYPNSYYQPTYSTSYQAPGNTYYDPYGLVPCVNAPCR